MVFIFILRLQEKFSSELSALFIFLIYFFLALILQYVSTKGNRWYFAFLLGLVPALISFADLRYPSWIFLLPEPSALIGGYIGEKLKLRK